MTYDGNRNRTVSQNSAGALTSYVYDGKDRLAQAKNTGASATYTYNYSYDGNDNIVFNTELNSTTFTYDAANRQVSGIDVSGRLYTMSYDANGNQAVVLGPVVSATSTYDKENRLILHAQSGIGPATYTYDPFGKKRSEFNPSSQNVLTTLVWDGDDYLQSRS